MREELEMDAERTRERTVGASERRFRASPDGRRHEERSTADRRRNRRRLTQVGRAAAGRRDEADKANKEKSSRSVDDVQPSAAPPVTGLSTSL